MAAFQVITEAGKSKMNNFGLIAERPPFLILTRSTTRSKRKS
jgi:hypothetical protein